jgi:hypothetical protein
VQPVAVGALGDQDIGAFGHFGIAQDGPRGPAEITGEHDALLRAPLFDVEAHHGAAEHVPSVVEGELHVVRDRDRRVVRHRDHALDGTNDVLVVVERLDAFLIEALLLGGAVEVARVLGLDRGRVAQHHGAERTRRGRGVDGAGVALLEEQRKRARVVDVRVGEHDRLDLGNRQVQVLIALDRLSPRPLEEPAVEQDAASLRAHEVHRTGDRLGCAYELELHAWQTTPTARHRGCVREQARSGEPRGVIGHHTVGTERLEAPHLVGIVDDPEVHRIAELL